MNLKHLKSGTDVRGTAVEGVAGQPVTLTSAAVAAITAAFALWLSERTGKTELKIGVGHDSRISAEPIQEAVVAQLKAAGCDLYLCGLCSTPSMFMMTQYPETDCDGAIMITASHHPYNKNGLKFFTKKGGIDGNDLDAILLMAENGEKRIGNTSRTFKRDFMALYCDLLVNKVRKAAGVDWPLTGFKIVVDAGNGAGGFYAERVLKPLGADVNGSQFLEPNGRFPNHIPNPEDKTAMRAISDCVKRNHADLGLIFDTDVDRAAVVSSNGGEINRNRLIALISDILLTEHTGCTVVTDSVTSDGLHNFITRRGGVHHRFKRGYRNVIDEAVRLIGTGADAQIAIETSGHAALKENYFLDDGAYLVTRIIMKMAQLKEQGQKLESLIADLEIPAEEREARISFTCENWKEVGFAVLNQLNELAQRNGHLILAPDNFEGVRARLGYAEGWFLARMSVHDPIMPINIESDKIGGAAVIAKFLYAFLSSFSGLDATPLKSLFENNTN